MDTQTVDIKRLEAGRELDALIAERIFGFLVWRTKQDAYAYAATHPDISPERGNSLGFPGVLRPDGFYSPLPFYSTVMGAAWEIVEYFRSIYRLSLGDAGVWWNARFTYKDSFLIGGSADADTAPLAICRAAIKIREIEKHK